ncbi:transcriptional regulator domain protein [Oceanithermus profundus DSM 14977]|uniref:Transcriptional regulator domain protein n=1 Tax=Oceanithermus profundus (strain DSM 14977 / NBRC 100410 / VKM B-2274 / 506) TaxID=670487 RepID=E4U774_OCEP5|nr:hypothetical protein [Oceanithermus profundus]ADR36203.1 transcriptional regulator domain protein [Oceanithermus profundus DSM 14977]
MEHPKVRLLEGARSIKVEAPVEYGTAHLADTFLMRAPEGHHRVWIELGREAQDHPVTVGNAFSDAVQTALGLLLPLGMEWQVLTELWSKQAHLFRPMTIAITGADRAPDFVARLMDCSSVEDRWFLAGENLDEFDLQKAERLLRASDLHLSVEDFSLTFVEKVGQEVLNRVIEESEGVFERILIRLHQESAIPEPVRPGPRGPRLLVPQPVAVNPEEALSHLLEKGFWKEALEMAASHVKERTGEVLAAGAGYYFLGRGESLQLYKILLNLIESGHADEEVLLWLVGAAQRLGKHEGLRDAVEAHLEEYEAPRLRAVYAGSLAPHELRLREARRAAAAREDELTLYFLGRELRDTDLLLKALRLAEKDGSAYAAIRNANALGIAFSRKGHLLEAHHYKRYAYTLLQSEHLVDPIARITKVNSYLYSGLLLGNPEPGLFEELTAFVNQHTLGGWWRAAMTTLIQYSWTKGDLEEARNKLDRLWHRTARKDRALLAPFAAHALRSWGEPRRALDLAREALTFSREGGGFARAQAETALGIAQLGEQEEASLEHLERARSTFSKISIEPPYKLRFYLAAALHALGQREEARGIMREVSPLTAALHDSALQLFMPPEALPLLGWGSKLSLNFLGGCHATLEGAPLELRLSHAEMLALLALHPRGLSLGELAAQYRDSVSPSTVKSTLSRLREIVPLASKPYRIAVEWDADFARLLELVRNGMVSQALDLYQGPLLPKSAAPGIEEHRTIIEETLRAAVLDQEDGPQVFNLAERLGDDLEVWEAARDRLLPGDSRRVIAEAQVRRLQRDYGIG